MVEILSGVFSVLSASALFVFKQCTDIDNEIFKALDVMKEEYFNIHETHSKINTEDYEFKNLSLHKLKSYHFSSIDDLTLIKSYKEKNNNNLKVTLVSFIVSLLFFPLLYFSNFSKYNFELILLVIQFCLLIIIGFCFFVCFQIRGKINSIYHKYHNNEY